MGEIAVCSAILLMRISLLDSYKRDFDKQWAFFGKELLRIALRRLPEWDRAPKAGGCAQAVPGTIRRKR